MFVGYQMSRHTMKAVTFLPLWLWMILHKRVFLIRTKSDLLKCFKRNGVEYRSKELGSVCYRKRTCIEYTTPYESEINRLERKMNKMLLEKEITMLVESCLPKYLYGYWRKHI